MMTKIEQIIPMSKKIMVYRNSLFLIITLITMLTIALVYESACYQIIKGILEFQAAGDVRNE